MPPLLEQIKKEVVDCCRRLSARRFVANHDGNITFRLDSRHLLATPTARAKKDIREDDLIIVDETGSTIEGRHKVFGEIFWHLAIYRARPDVGAIVHGHPPTASAFGLARKEIGTPAIPEAIVSLGRSILNLDFYSPLDSEIKTPASAFEKNISEILKENDAMIAPGNGVWAVGTSVLQTYLRLELVEQIALQHFTAHQMGRIEPLSSAIVEALLLRRPPRKLFDFPAEMDFSLKGLSTALNSEARTLQKTPERAQEKIREIVEDEVKKLLIH